MSRRMKRKTPEQKWNRLQAQIQAGIEKAYPNPERTGCPNRVLSRLLCKRRLPLSIQRQQLFL
jgi:hypothetical protein